jgi:hypothetical protein
MSAKVSYIHIYVHIIYVIIHTHTHTHKHTHLIKDESKDQVEHGRDSEASGQRRFIADHILELAHTQSRELGS